jgi:hypothetical protein
MSSATIQVRETHVSSETAYAAVLKARSAATRIDGATAVTIASWWQSPGRIGSVLAGFASGAEVARQDLLDDIDATRAEQGEEQIAGRDSDALHSLAAFVSDHS